MIPLGILASATPRSGAAGSDWLAIALDHGAFYCATGELDGEGKLIDFAGGRSVVVPQLENLPGGGPGGSIAARIKGLASQKIISTDPEFGLKGDNWTVEAWLYMSSSQTRWLEWAGGAYDTTWAIKGYSKTSLDLWLSGGRKAVGGVPTNEPGSIGRWVAHHWTFDGVPSSSQATLISYVDGAVVDIQTGPLGRINPSGSNRFGIGGSDGSYVSPPGNWRMARIALYQRTLTPAEVAAHAAA